MRGEFTATAGLLRVKVREEWQRGGGTVCFYIWTKLQLRGWWQNVYFTFTFSFWLCPTYFLNLRYLI